MRSKERSNDSDPFEPGSECGEQPGFALARRDLARVTATGALAVTRQVMATARTSAHERPAAEEALALGQRHIAERYRPGGGTVVKRFAGDPVLFMARSVKEHHPAALAHAPDPVPTERLDSAKPGHTKARIRDEDRPDTRWQKRLQPLQERRLDARGSQPAGWVHLLIDGKCSASGYHGGTQQTPTPVRFDLAPIDDQDGTRQAQ